MNLKAQWMLFCIKWKQLLRYNLLSFHQGVIILIPRWYLRKLSKCGPSACPSVRSYTYTLKKRSYFLFSKIRLYMCKLQQNFGFSTQSFNIFPSQVKKRWYKIVRLRKLNNCGFVHIFVCQPIWTRIFVTCSNHDISIFQSSWNS